MNRQPEILQQLATEGGTQSLAELKESAENGNMDAQWELAQYYWENPECGTLYDGINWARKAAEQGHPEAEVAVGNFCEDRLDEPQAAMWYKRAAEHGSVLGDYYLGLFYKEGRGGLPRDPERAEQCFLHAGHYVEAAYEYYECYRERVGDREDNGWEQAIALLMKSADGGYAPAQYTLGMLYESAENFEEAQNYLKAAAKQKHPLAVKHLQTVADQKYAVVHTGLINSDDYETALAHLKKGIKRDKIGIYSYLYGDFWEHNYGNLLPWDDNRPNVTSRINIAAGWYAYSYMRGYEAALEQLIRCFLIGDCGVEPTAEQIAAVENFYDKNGYLHLTYGNCKSMFYGIKPDL